MKGVVQVVVFLGVALGTEAFGQTAPPEGLSVESGAPRIKVSDAKVIEALKADDVKTIEVLLASGWDASQPLVLGEKKDSVGLIVPDNRDPLLFAFQKGALDSAIAIAARTPVEKVDLTGAIDSAGYAFSSKKWSAASAPQSAAAGQVLDVFLRSGTPSAGKSKALVEAYKDWPIRVTDRLPVLKRNQLKREQLSADAANKMFGEAVRQYRLSAAISEEAAADEIRTLVALGADVNSVPLAFGDDSPLSDSCTRFSSTSFSEYCETSTRRESLPDPRIVKSLVSLGWKPSQQSVDKFWTDALLPNVKYNGNDLSPIYTAYSCALETDVDFMSVYRSAGKGYRIGPEAANARQALEMLALPTLEPSPPFAEALEKATKSYSKTFVGKDACGKNCPPLENTFCGAAAALLK